jgi:hypothetical protein
MSSSSEDKQECVLCDSRGYDFSYTPCCHEMLCENCEEEVLLYECSNNNCLMNSYDNRWCITCFDINSVSNRCKKCNYTWCNDCSETHICKDEHSN